MGVGFGLFVVWCLFEVFVVSLLSCVAWWLLFVAR